jgi:uncharacterized membrane protein YoaK (UPF0700 family)
LDAFHPPCRLDIVTEKPRVGIVRNYVSHPAHGPLPALLLALTVVTGLVDAVSIIALGRVFVANMTGNIVFAGFALAGVPGYSGWGSVFALIGFVTGATGGGVVLLRTTRNRGKLLRNAVSIELILTLGGLAIALVAGRTLGNPAQYAIVLLLSFALGVRNSVVRHLAVPDMTTTVLTMAITGIGADLRKRDTTSVLRRLLSIAAMLVGAHLGAVLILNVGAPAALETIAVMLLVIGILATVASRRPSGWQVEKP